ncbi:MAG TPA: LysR family transcriptional regulator [Acetobacteraceae bacterium]|jgi:DNA-binding transcriptional LysR family regulator|nr:LysR family transcriptional regulator [Acetobacteraceae bacterium]
MDVLGALRAFVRITETGSFSAVARETNASQSAVTRLIAQLEQHFGVRLFHRTTRRLSLTDDGKTLLGHARHLLEGADEMEAALGRQSGEPRGLVRLGTSVAGGLFLATRLPVLLGRYPGLSVELVMSDRQTDMIEERLDLAFRSGEIADASLVARRAGVLGRAVVAAPIYLERQGAPERPEDLADHACLIHDATPEPDVWRFTGPEGPVSVQVSGALLANDSEAVRRAARAGHGVALLPEIQCIDDLRAGRLFRLLEDYPSQRVPVHIVYPSRRNLAPRTRVVMDFLVEQTRQISALLQQGAEVLT